MRTAPSKTGGFSLLESLIALVVLSVGLLGLAGLHMKALQHTNVAESHSQATLLAMDIIDRMRANRAAALAGAYTGHHGPVPCDPGFHGNNASIITRDLTEWANSLACSLPQGEGIISVSSEQVMIRLRWTEARHLNDSDANDAHTTVRFTATL